MLCMAFIMLLVSNVLHAQTKVPKKEKVEVKSETPSVSAASSDTTLSINLKGSIHQDTIPKIFVVLGDDGSATYNPVVHVKGFLVARYVSVPQQQPIVIWQKLYTNKWAVINDNDVIQAIDVKKTQ